MKPAGRNKTPSPAAVAGKKLVQARLPFKKLSTLANPLANVCAASAPSVAAPPDTISVAAEQNRKRKLSNNGDDSVLRATKVNRTDNQVTAELPSIITLADSDDESKKIEPTANKDNCPEEAVAMEVDANNDIGNKTDAADDNKKTGHDKKKSKSKKKSKEKKLVWDEEEVAESAKAEHGNVSIRIPLPRKRKLPTKKVSDAADDSKAKRSETVTSSSTDIIDLDDDNASESIKIADETVKKIDEGKLEDVKVEGIVAATENEAEIAANESKDSVVEVTTLSVNVNEDSGKTAETSSNKEGKDKEELTKQLDATEKEDKQSSPVKNEESEHVKRENTSTETYAANVTDEPTKSPKSSIESSPVAIRNDEASNESTKTDDNSDVIEIVDGDAEPELTTTPKRSAAEVSSSKFQTPDNQKLTQKQLKRKLESEKKQLERQRAKEERDRKLQDEKEQRQREKEEKERQRRKEREDREDQRRKERDEKEEQKRREKEDRERKRQSEIDAKNEERRKREEEKQLAEDAKNQEKQKQKAAFTKFFVVKRSDGDAEEKVNGEQQNFMPFQVKDAMKLAPTIRRKLADDRRDALEAAIRNDDGDGDDVKALPLAELYLKQLRSGARAPERYVRTLPTDDDSSDVIIVGDELNQSGQIIEESKRKQLYRAKFLKFEENRRPPYYGTWRKTSNNITARKPFTIDNKFFDYEVDSDDEWEEEEPGESLNGSEDEKESVDDYDIDNEFFVPHGHLSDEELAKEDETDEDNSPAAQKARLQIVQKEFADEMKKKTEKIKPRLIGLIWQTKDGAKPDTVPPVIWDTLKTRAMLFQGLCVLMRKPAKESDAPAGDSDADDNDGLDGGAKPITVKRVGKITEDMIADLIRLLHGNVNSKNSLAPEFRAYLTAKTGKPSNVSTVSIVKTIKELATYGPCPEEGFTSCWYVSAEKRKQYDVMDVSMPNTWTYVLKKPKKLAAENGTRHSKEPDKESADIASSMVVDQPPDESATTAKPLKTKAAPTNGGGSIAKFTTVLTADDKRRQFEMPMATDTTAATTGVTVAGKKSDSNGEQKPKKRVNLLMSHPLGEEISTTAKDAAVRKFLSDNATTANDTNGPKSRTSTPNAASTTATTTIMKFATKLTAEEKLKSFAIPAPKSTASTGARKANVDASGGGKAKATGSVVPSSEKPKKRVNLLMSVARNEEIPVAAKDEAVRKFLARNTCSAVADTSHEKTETITTSNAGADEKVSDVI